MPGRVKNNHIDTGDLNTMGNPTKVIFIREAVLLSRSAQYWPVGDVTFSTIGEFANEAGEKIRMIPPVAEKEMERQFSDIDTFYVLEEFFDDVFSNQYLRLEDIDHYGAATVADFEKGNPFWGIEDHKATFSPAIQKRIDTFKSLSTISLPPQHYSPFQCIVHIRKMYGMELFEWQEMEELVIGIDNLRKRVNTHYEWEQIIDAHRMIPYDYAIFWSFV